MPPKNSDDQGDNPDKLNFSKTQLTVIVGSIAAIVVLALALGFLTKKNDATLEEQTNVEAPPIEQATEMPLPDGAKQEELSKLEGALPKQVPQTPDEEELKQKAEKKAETASPTPVSPVPAAPLKSEVSPAPATPPKGAAAPIPAPSTPVPGAIVEKTASKPIAKIMEEKAEPKKEKKAKHEKPKKKRVYPRQRKTAQPLQKHVDVKKMNAAPKAEPRKEPAKTGDAQVNDAKAGKLENKPGASSFSTEIKPDAVPPAPATVEVPAAPVASKVVEPLAAEPQAVEPKFTLLAETVASEADAKSRVTALIKNGHQAYYLKKATTKNTWYRVMTGAYATREEADAAAAEFGQKERTTVKVFPYEKP